MNVFRAARIARSHSLVVNLPSSPAFELFTPEGERAWAEGWDPTYHFPSDGRPEAGMVFTTGHGGEHTIWTMIRYEPAAGRVSYTRTTPGSRTGIVDVRCEATDATSTRVHVSYTLTALSAEGNLVLAEMTEEKFRGFIDSWRQSIEAAISRRRGS